MKSSNERLIDPVSAEEAIDAINAQLESLTNSSERAGRLLCKAVFLCTLNRFSEAQSVLQLALRECPDDPAIQLGHEFVRATLSHAQQKIAEAFQQFTTVLRDRSAQLSLPENRAMYEDIQQAKGV